MRKPNISLLPVITIVFAVFTLGFFLGRNQSCNDIVVSVPENMLTLPACQPASNTEPPERVRDISFPVSINRAGKEEFMALPGIGEVLAERIIRYRGEIGRFSSVEELLNVDGVGAKHLEEIRDLITIGG